MTPWRSLPARRATSATGIRAGSSVRVCSLTAAGQESAEVSQRRPQSPPDTLLRDDWGASEYGYGLPMVGVGFATGGTATVNAVGSRSSSWRPDPELTARISGTISLAYPLLTSRSCP